MPKANQFSLFRPYYEERHKTMEARQAAVTELILELKKKAGIPKDEVWRYEQNMIRFAKLLACECTRICAESLKVDAYEDSATFNKGVLAVQEQIIKKFDL